MRNRVTGLVLSLALLVIVLVGSCANVMPVNTNVDSTLSTATTVEITKTLISTIAPTATPTNTPAPSNSQAVVQPTDSQTQTEAPINPWPTKWPSSTIIINGTTVTLTSHPPNPNLYLDSSMMTLITKSGVDPIPQVRLISATYDDTDWEITTDAPWLVVSPTSGVASPRGKSISISAGVSGLAPNTYLGHITVTAHVFNSPIIIHVQLIVQK